MIKDELSIIYSTCDKYKSLWPGFFTLLNKYWKDCDCKIILNTESCEFKFKGLNISKPLYCDGKMPWSMRLKKSLEKVDTEYVLLMLDDFYIKSDVDTKAIESCIEEMNKNKAIQSFVFASQPGKNHECKYKSFEKRGRFSLYRINTQIGIWRVSYLNKIIKENETPWEFELNGSFRSTVLGGDLYSIKKGTNPIFDYDYGFLVIRGMINPELKTYFEESEKINMDLPFDIYSAERLYSNTKDTVINKCYRYFKYATSMCLSTLKK